MSIFFICLLLWILLGVIGVYFVNLTERVEDKLNCDNTWMVFFGPFLCMVGLVCAAIQLNEFIDRKTNDTNH